MSGQRYEKTAGLANFKIMSERNEMTIQAMIGMETERWRKAGH